MRRSDRDFARFCDVIGQAQLDQRRARKEKLPAIEYTAHVHRIDAPHAHRQLKVKAGIFHPVVGKPFMDLERIRWHASSIAIGLPVKWYR